MRNQTRALLSKGVSGRREWAWVSAQLVKKRAGSGQLCSAACVVELERYLCKTWGVGELPK